MDIRIYKQGDPEYLLSLILRYKILRIPLGLTFSKDDLAKDKDDIHIGLFDGDVILACLILTDTGHDHIKMRQVAVDDSRQSRGLGKKLVQYADEYARQQGYTLIHCHARGTARSFYEKLGYMVVGDEFPEVGIRHFYMEKRL